MQAVADALSLHANIVMAWNTAKMQAIFDRWALCRSGAIPPELIGPIAPTRTTIAAPRSPIKTKNLLLTRRETP